MRQREEQGLTVSAVIDHDFFLASHGIAWQRTGMFTSPAQLQKQKMQPETLFAGILGALGLFLGMANPIYQLPILALVYPAALAWQGHTASGLSNAFQRGWFTGTLGASACLYWISVPVTEVAGQPLAVGILCAVALGAYVGLFGGAFALLVHTTRSCSLLRRTVLAALGWFLLETLRGWLFTGFAWLPLAAAFVPWISWIQPVAWIGAYGLGGFLAACASLIALGLHNKQWIVVLCALLVLLLAPHAGMWRLQSLEATGEDMGEALSIALVQGNIDQNQKWDRRYLDETLKRYIQLSRKTNARLVVWPETAVPIDYPRHELSRSLRTYATEQNQWLLFGAPGLERTSPRDALFNRAWLISPQGRNVGRYEKEHLVPFGEYVPTYVNLPFLQGLLQGIGDFTPGRTVAPLVLHPRDGTLATQVDLGLLICYETIFPELSRQRVADGATLLVNISNDAWFGKSSAPEQHLHISALRAVEQQRWLARGTNTGVSAFIAPTGRITQRSELFVSGTLEGTVFPNKSTTLFFRCFPLLTPVGSMLFLLVLFIPRRKTVHV